MANETQTGIDGTIVAIISAAVAAASGPAAGTHRIASISVGGFNTPIWGHVERFTRNDAPSARSRS